MNRSNYLYLLILLVFFGFKVTCIAEPILTTDEQQPDEALYNEFPFIVSIGRIRHNRGKEYTFQNGHFCGGSLISKSHVLTSAHCLLGEEPKNTRVLVGKNKFTDTPTSYNVEWWKIYKDWERRLDTSLDHDVAIIKLSGEITDSDAAVITLYPNAFNRDTNSILYSAGWGKRSNPLLDTSPVLVKIPLKLVTNAQCARDLSRENGLDYDVTIQHMCTRSTRNLQLGEGDSGGPLVYKKNEINYLIGINEAQCSASRSLLNTHSRISYYRNFIDAMKLL